jgi:hypothetical protein
MNRLWLAAVPALLVGCISRNEVSRVSSPDGAFDAVLLESSEPTSSFDYNIYVVKRGATLGRSPAAAYLHEALRSSDAYGVTLKWADANNLAVEYLTAKKVTLALRDLHVEGRDIRITLRADVSDPSAPAGGMLNLPGRPSEHGSSP